MNGIDINSIGSQDAYGTEYAMMFVKYASFVE